MSTSSSFTGDLHDVIRYRERDLVKLVVYLAVVVAAVYHITRRWEAIWFRSITRQVFDGIAAALPVGTDPVYGFPLFFLVGLALLFLFDGYKRVQGVLLAAGIFALFGTATALGHLRWNWFAPGVLASLVVGVLLGLFVGGARKAWNSTRRTKLEDGFVLLQLSVAALGLLMIIEYLLVFAPPTGPLTELTVPQLLQLSLDLLVVGVLVAALREFTNYEVGSDVLVLGPSRAGKTWFMAGLAYTFNEPNVDEDVEDRTELSYEMEALYDQYDRGDFESIGPTDTDMATPMELKTDIGGFFGGRLRIRSADYSGEKLADLDLKTSDGPQIEEELRDRKEQFFDEAGDEEIDWDDLQGQLDGESYEVEDLLKVLVVDADVVCLVLPTDAVMDPDEWSDDELRDPLKVENDLDITHDPPKRHDIRDEDGYYDIYKDVRDLHVDGTLSGEVVFLGTKADLLAKAFDDEHNESPSSNWPDFREFVWEYASEQHTDVDFRPNGNLDEFFPVYFESENDRTDREEYIKPIKEREEGNELVERSPLRGLRHLIRRLR
jgi:hypothetical protein